MRYALLLWLGLAAGCSTLLPSPGDNRLGTGLRLYQQGHYKQAERQIRRALDEGLYYPDNRVEAYKHLAFIACVTKRRALCEREFRQALATNPFFELEPTEVNHPMWGPAFRRAKAAPRAQVRPGWSRDAL